MSSKKYYVIAPVEGLHLLCDFRIHSAEIYGCPPNYSPAPDVYPVFRKPYDYLSQIPFEQYQHFNQEFWIDNISIENLLQVKNINLQNYSCLAFEMEFDGLEYLQNNLPEFNNALLEDLLNRGEKILDVLRLSLFKPGQNRSIVGALGKGISGVWLGVDSEKPKFIARKTSRYELVQPMIDVPLEALSPIYYDFTFRALSHVACSPTDPLEVDNLIFRRIFEGLRFFSGKSRNCKLGGSIASFGSYC